MIKGINKQIIEIRCTDDEYFDKVLLFVRADKSGTPEGILKKGANNCCGKILHRCGVPSGRRRRNGVKIAALILSLLILSVLFLYLTAAVIYG
jgi:hypothetical protein